MPFLGGAPAVTRHLVGGPKEVGRLPPRPTPGAEAAAMRDLPKRVFPRVARGAAPLEVPGPRDGVSDPSVRAYEVAETSARGDALRIRATLA